MISHSVAPGPAHGDGHGHSGDVAYSHRPGYRGGQGLKLRDLARVMVVVVAPADEPDGMGETANVYEAQIQREEEPARDQPDHDEGDLRSEQRDGEENES